MSPSLVVSPLEFRFPLDSSTSSTHIITIENPTSSRIDFSLSVQPLSSIDPSFTQLSRWVSFPNGKEYSLEPNSSLDVPFVVTTPTSLPDGGQYAELFLTLSPNDVAEPTDSLTVLTQISLPLYGVVSSGETIRRSELRSISLSPAFTTSHLVASSTIVNTGNIDFSAASSFSVSSILGSKLHEASSFVNVLPGSEKSVFFEWSDTPGLGLYRLTYSIEASGLNTSLSRIVLVASPIHLAIFSLLIITIIAIATILHLAPKHKNRA